MKKAWVKQGDHFQDWTYKKGWKKVRIVAHLKSLNCYDVRIREHGVRTIVRIPEVFMSLTKPDELKPEVPWEDKLIEIIIPMLVRVGFITMILSPFHDGHIMDVLILASFASMWITQNQRAHDKTLDRLDQILKEISISDPPKGVGEALNRGEIR